MVRDSTPSWWAGSKVWLEPMQPWVPSPTSCIWKSKHVIWLLVSSRSQCFKEIKAQIRFHRASRKAYCLTLIWWSLEPVRTTSCPLPNLSTAKHRTGPKWPVSFPVDANLWQKTYSNILEHFALLWPPCVTRLTCGGPTYAQHYQQQRRGSTPTGLGRSGWSDSLLVAQKNSWQRKWCHLNPPAPMTWQTKPQQSSF